MDEIDADPDILWKFAFWHHPVYSAESERPGERWIRDHVLPELEGRGFDIIGNGHHHIYSRSYPIFDGTPYMMGEPAHYIDPPGIIHIISGGGGQGLGETQDVEYIAAHEAVHHFTVVQIVGNRLDLQAYSKYGRLIDEMSITKTIER